MLRTDLFKTVDRVKTRFIAVRDSLTKPGDPSDIRDFDTLHCKRGRLGVGWHFVVQRDGTIQLGRNLNTCGSHSKGLDDISVAIGVVGGTDEAGARMFTRTSEQVAAINDLIDFLSPLYPAASVSDQATQPVA